MKKSGDGGKVTKSLGEESAKRLIKKSQSKPSSRTSSGNKKKAS